ncbi:MAG: MerR family transcriptional regulator [Sandaracinobacteroides sp.]
MGESLIVSGTAHLVASPATCEPPAGRLPADAQLFTITDLAREFGVTSRTLRFYEDEGLIHPSRRGTTRLYSRGDRARLAWILRGRSVGFSLADIRELLDMYAPGPARRQQIQATVAKSRDRIAALLEQRAAIDATIAELENFCRTIEAQL